MIFFWMSINFFVDFENICLVFNRLIVVVFISVLWVLVGLSLVGRSLVFENVVYELRNARLFL